jgi:hypothetical protein
MSFARIASLLTTLIVPCHALVATEQIIEARLLLYHHVVASSGFNIVPVEADP